MTLLEFIVQRYINDMRSEGVPMAIVTQRAETFEADIRRDYGARLNYVHGVDLEKRNREIVLAWDARLRANGRSKTKAPIQKMRDEVCAAFGIKRVTFYSVIGAAKCRRDF